MSDKSLRELSAADSVIESIKRNPVLCKVSGNVKIIDISFLCSLTKRTHQASKGFPMALQDSARDDELDHVLSISNTRLVLTEGF